MSEQRSKAAARTRREMKTASTPFLVLFLFIVCRISLHITNCFLPLELLLTAIILSHANSADHPFGYAFKNGTSNNNNS